MEIVLSEITDRSGEVRERSFNAEQAAAREAALARNPGTELAP
jgi:hypothetical protein